MGNINAYKSNSYCTDIAVKVWIILIHNEMKILANHEFYPQKVICNELSWRGLCHILGYSHLEKQNCILEQCIAFLKVKAIVSNFHIGGLSL